MSEKDLCCYIVPSEDEHQSEYVSSADQRRSFISGFTGSAGVACISRDLLNFNQDHPEGKSILSTDGRYFNQASQELDFNWTLLRQGEDKLTWPEWCINEAKEMSVALGGKEALIGIDPKLISYDQVLRFQKLIEDKLEGSDAKVSLVPVVDNLVDAIWSGFEPLPVRDANDLLLLSSHFTDETYQQKRERLLTALHAKIPGCNTFCVAALDEICWLLNPVSYTHLDVYKRQVCGCAACAACAVRVRPCLGWRRASSLQTQNLWARDSPFGAQRSFTATGHRGSMVFFDFVSKHLRKRRNTARVPFRVVRCLLYTSRCV